eukprot:TRINITY_DN12501_c0_g1_i3.p1 TRINITY_DN12501_c0_g1~~TRINITY_DN12501_c0_g1_i3.p1  ORF type:complete len:385 (+),score=90.56 TRINITY_DN12501_c0_g1_i3:231-1385(+)
MEGADHREYVRQFLEHRRSAGCSLQQVLAQFRMPATHESWADADGLPDRVIKWIQEQRDADEQDCEPVKLVESTWDPSRVKVALHGGLDAAEAEGREDVSRVVVFDGMFGEDERRQIFKTLLGPGGSEAHPCPPVDRWQLSVCDDGAGKPTWGPNAEVLEQLLSNPGVIEIQSRLAKLYPQYTVAHIPAVDLTTGGHEIMAHRMVANAPLADESFDWHIDADPALLPDSPFVTRHGRYPNRQPGKPLFVSLIVYLNAEWLRSWGAETMFLDLESDAGFMVLPKAGRAVLMEQDMTHRICAPSAAAGRPRYSLVWKLVFLPKEKESAMSIQRAGLGKMTLFGGEHKRDQDHQAKPEKDCNPNPDPDLDPDPEACLNPNDRKRVKR